MLHHVRHGTLPRSDLQLRGPRLRTFRLRGSGTSDFHSRTLHAASFRLSALYPLVFHAPSRRAKACEHAPLSLLRGPHRLIGRPNGAAKIALATVFIKLRHGYSFPSIDRRSARASLRWLRTVDAGVPVIVAISAVLYPS